MKVGIIGFGSFGAFAAKVLAAHAQVFVWSNRPSGVNGVPTVDFDELAGMDVIILAIPLDAYEEVLMRLRPMLRAATVVVDICSVKVKSREVMLRVLEGHENILITHPLFGPESAAGGTNGHDIIVTDAIGTNAEQCITFCADMLGLRVTRISAEEHDRVMAYVHVLTLFVARGLGNMKLPDIPFRTPSFGELVDLIELDKKHSDELFMTIQQGNPYADEVRRELIDSFISLEQSLTKSR